MSERIANLREQEATDFDNFSDDELNAFLMEESLNLNVEREIQEISTNAIKGKEHRVIQNFTEIRNLLSKDITEKFLELDDILSRWELLLHSDHALSDIGLVPI